MQSATQATLTNLVEQHITSLVRESAVVNRHSNKGGYVSAAGNDTNSKKKSTHYATTQGGREKRRRLIHHDDINLALSWRGSDKLYVSGIPLSTVEDDITTPHNQLVQNTTGKASLLGTTAVVPKRVDLNSYLQSEM